MTHSLSALSQIVYRCLTTTNVRQNFYQIFKKVSEQQEIVKITNNATGKSAFLINEEDFASVIETMYLIDSGMLEELLAAKNEPLAEGVNLEAIDWLTT